MLYLGHLRENGEVAMNVVLPRKYIGAQHGTDDIAEVRNIVHIRQCACDQDVMFALDGQYFVTVFHFEKILKGEKKKVNNCAL